VSLHPLITWGETGSNFGDIWKVERMSIGERYFDAPDQSTARAILDSEYGTDWNTPQAKS
jgi:hypothetical protein